MTKYTRFLSLLLACFLLLGLLAACASSSEPPVSGDAETIDSNLPAMDPDDLTTIDVSYLDCFGMADHYDRIEAAINEYTEPQLGIHVNMLFWDFGSYATNTTLRLSGGEQYDVMNVTPMLSFSALYAQHQLMECRDVLETYASDAIQVLGQYASAYEMDGGLYGLPNLRLYQTNAYLCMNRDILDELGLTRQAEAAASWSDIEALFTAIHDARPELILIGGGEAVLPSRVLWPDDSFADAVIPDTLGDPTASVYVQDGTVTNKWANPDLVNTMRRLADWNARGWVWQDAMQSNEELALMKAGTLFCKPLNTEFGGESNMRSQIGHDVLHVLTAESCVDTKVLNEMGVAIPVTAEEPEAAAQFINALYTVPELVTLFCWGEEGTDYVLNDAGEACYPDSGMAYHNGDFMIGNQFLVPPWEGSGGDFRTRAEAVNAAAPVSKYLGFSVDTSELANEIAAISAITDEYLPRLFCGYYEESLYQEMLSKLDATEIDSYLLAIQAQLDAWSAQ